MLHLERLLLQKIEKKIMPVVQVINIFATPSKKWHKIYSKLSYIVYVLVAVGVSRQEKAESEEERVLLL